MTADPQDRPTGGDRDRAREQDRADARAARAERQRGSRAGVAEMATTVQNPYLDRVLAIGFDHEDSRWGRPAQISTYTRRDGYREHRRDLVREYAWAIPTPEALEAIAELSPIVEIGAGTGYWAWLLEQMGADVVAYDHVPGAANSYGHERQWTTVAEGGPTKARRHSDRALFLCWPPYATPMASQCLRYYRGDTLIYVGEGSGGCTGDDRFHRTLSRRWHLEREIELMQWSGIHDSLHIYRRLPRGGSDA